MTMKEFCERMMKMDLFREKDKEGILYHVSVERIAGNRLWQRIPKDRAEGEDKTMKRICFAKTLEGCITAMPNGVKVARNLSLCELHMGLPAILHIYSIKRSDIPDENIKDSNYLLENNLVPDADETGEVWVVNQDVVCNHSVIRLKSIETTIVPCNWRENKMVVKVKDIEFERSIEFYDREYTYKFRKMEDLNKIKRYALKSGCAIFREDHKEDGRYYLGVKVPSGIDARGLWQKTDHLLWKRLEEYYKNESGKKKLLPKRVVLAHLDIENKT